ncbi:hypothetical protein IW147_005665 [Coemansia sp. RSA 720]|nr:hypothetical protein IW147_005665 [Coemansia sp. RSA 720]
MNRSLVYPVSDKPCLAEPTQAHMDPSTYTSSAPTRKRRRPPYSYTALIAQAIIVSEHKQLTLREIYDSINCMYPQICQGPDIGWQNTIRHNLSLNSCFKRIPRGQLPSSLSSKLRGKGSYWTVDVALMDCNTRKRLEEAINTMGSSTETSPRLCKRAKSVQSTTIGLRTKNTDSVRCVSPTVQSSPYFQSTLNTPISSAPKPALKHYQRRPPHVHELDGFSAIPTPVSTPRSTYVPRNRFYSRPVGCVDAHFSLDARPWTSSGYLADHRASLMPAPASPYLFGSAVSCARSTARPSTELMLDMPSSASSSALGSRQHSPYTLSPAPSAETNVGNEYNDTSSKHDINHLLN